MPSESLALNEAQRRVVNHAAGGMLVLGGPGTGKTETIAEAVAQRLQRCGDGPRPLVVCFSRRAAARMRDRIAEIIQGAVESPLAITMHAFCLAVVRRFAPLDGPELRLLTAPEQELRMRELLAGTRSDAWPSSLRLAIGTRGFARELRSFLARARQLGLDPTDIVSVARSADVPEWASAGDYFEDYLDVLDAEGALDYAELVHRCRILLSQPDVAATLRREIHGVYVDEAQDLDPSQLGVLRQLVEPGGLIVACGDPDQAAFGFRGAHPRALAEFMRLFSTAGSEAQLEVLSQSYRVPEAVRDAASSVAERLPLPGLPRGALARFRDLEPQTGGGSLRVHTLDSQAEEAAFLARELRTAHLIDNVPWSQMAVIVRAGRRMIPALRRTLGAMGVPVEVAGDEIPLSAELAVRPLLLALAVASRRTSLDPDVAERLLTSPLAGLDSVELRGLRRALRDADRAQASGGMPRSSGELVAAALREPELLAELPDGKAPEAAMRLASLLASARHLADSGAAAVDVLWHMWDGTPWPEQLLLDVDAGGHRARRADRDLDAVCALFDVARRSDSFVGVRGVAVFLEEVAGQSIPADTLREASVRGDAVRVLTAHRAKGLQWRRVFVAGVQEGIWPDFRTPDPLLHENALPDPPAGVNRIDNLASSRRLFYIAITRATEQTTITAVAGSDGEADQPSRFLRELGAEEVPVSAVSTAALSLDELVVKLRRAAIDPLSSDGVRRAAATRLAQLADLGARAADPTSWWGMLPLSAAASPQDVSRIRLSGSQLGSLLSCPRQYFLSREVKAETARSSAASLGSVIHALAQHALTDDLPSEELTAHLDEIWDQIPFDAAWLSVSERVEAELALMRLTNWTREYSYRRLVGVEVPFQVELQVAGTTVVLTGAVDRLEHDGEGGLRIVDFKTGRRPPTAAEVASLDQLGVYQLAVTLGAFERHAPGVRRAGGGELVLLRQPDGNSDFPKRMSQPSLTDQPHPPSSGPKSAPTWVHERLAEAVDVVKEGRYPATPGEDVCRFCQFAASCPARGGKQVVR